jgi:hypothetical protein
VSTLPAHAAASRRTARGLALAALLAAGCAAAAGCGPQPPQAPVAQANRVASAITGIAAACGELRQQRAFAPTATPEPQIRFEAQLRVDELATVYRAGPQWVYNGETLQQIVALSVSYLRECGLHEAAARLEQRTR